MFYSVNVKWYSVILTKFVNHDALCITLPDQLRCNTMSNYLCINAWCLKIFVKQHLATSQGCYCYGKHTLALAHVLILDTCI